MLNPAELKTLVEDRPDLVRAKRSERYPELRVLKYKPKVFFDNLWDQHPLLVHCRGLVVDNDYNVVVKPFTKVFNRFENNTDINPDELVTAVVKVNGFFGCVTNWGGRSIVSTTGTLDSEYAQLAETYIGEYGEKISEGSSAMFEIVDPSDPHIITERTGAHLIGLNERGYWYPENKLDLIHATHGLGDYRPNWGRSLFSEVVQLAKSAKHEGYMVYGQNTSLKLKSPYYLTTKLFARIHPEKLEKLLKTQRSLRIDEDYLPVMQHLRETFEDFILLDEQQGVSYVREFIEQEIMK